MGDTFEIKGWEHHDRDVVFSYTCSTFGDFSERVTFPVSFETADKNAPIARLLDLAAAFIGVSYYKLAAHPTIAVRPALGPDAQASVQKIYTDGLGEFYYRNDLPYPPALTFDFAPGATPVDTPPQDTKPASSVLAFGGGKDSHVAKTLLNQCGLNSEFVSVVLSHGVQEKLQSLSGDPVTFIDRRLDPEFLALGRAKKGYDGHIPITAINSVLLSLYAQMTDRNQVIFANERGASVPTLFVGSIGINHQYSKSFEFENLLRAALKQSASAAFDYFSILRPFSELWIAAVLANEAPDRLAVFSSCNRNFRSDVSIAEIQKHRWCGHCPKCVYTALLFAPHLSRAAHRDVFGTDLLNETRNVAQVLDLCGLGTQKPWECVGDITETAALVHMLSENADWRDALCVRKVGELVGETRSLQASVETVRDALESRGPDNLPAYFKSLLDHSSYSQNTRTEHV